MSLKSKPDGAEGRSAARLTEMIIGAAIEVHRHTGPGLMESAYEACLCYELSHLGLGFQRQVNLPLLYRGVKLDCAYKMDLVVEDTVVLELKTVEHLLPIHSAQLLTYLKLSGKTIGLLMNFNEPILTKGVKRLVKHFREGPVTPVTSASSAREPGEDILETQRLGVSAVKN